MNHSKGTRGDGHRGSDGGGAGDARLPCVLLVEDDAISAAFLADAIAAVPARVVTAGTLAEAERIAQARTCALWLIDAHLPDGHGGALLARLRARGLRVPALAHTADASRAALDGLIDAGFEEVLIKPLRVATLHGAIRRFIGPRDAPARTAPQTAPHTSPDPPPRASGTDFRATDKPRAPGKLPVWDDDAAVRALNGNRAHVALMRQLFRAELPAQAGRIATALRDEDTAALRSELHKLLASAGLVGAARLARAARELHAAPHDDRARLAFDGGLRDTRDALGDQDAPPSG